MRVNGLVLVMAVAVLGSVAGAMEVSTKNNIGGHMEYAGFTIVPVTDVAAPVQAEDLSSPQMFEVIRPGNQSFTLGRLYTSCTCIQIVTDKKNYGAGERAFITLRNIRHNDGQMFPFYVQVNSPLRVILRHDAWVKSDASVSSAVQPVVAAVVEPVVVAVTTPVVAATAPVRVSSGYQPVPLTADLTETLAGESYAVPASPAPEYVPTPGEYVMSDKDLF